MANELPSEATEHPNLGAAPDIPAIAGSDGPKDDRVRKRAYLIWLNEGQPHGRDLDHWLRAEWELEQEPNQ